MIFSLGLMNDGWKADFDFMMRTDKATAILEGKYDNKKSINREEKHIETEEEKIARKTRELKESIANGD